MMALQIAPQGAALSTCAASPAARGGAMQLKHRRVKQREVPCFWGHVEESRILTWLGASKSFVFPILLGLL